MKPSVLKQGFTLGMGYRPSWRLGNIIQAKIAKRLNLNVFLAQQSVREINRTGRDFKDVIDSAVESAKKSKLDIPWGADADHLLTEEHLKQAVDAGYTHFTFDVSKELGLGLDSVIEKITRMYNFLKCVTKSEFSTEISLDEAKYQITGDDIEYIIIKLREREVFIDEIAPKFPGHFEKGIDYYYKIRGDRDTEEFEICLRQIMEILDRYGVRLSVHSGSDKFCIYPILGRYAKDKLHLKTAGTYWLEELKLVAKYEPDLFKSILRFCLDRFPSERRSYELTTDVNNLPNISKLSDLEIVKMLDSETGDEDLRQVLHVTYGSVLSNKEFYDACLAVLESHPDEHYNLFFDYVMELVSKINVV